MGLNPADRISTDLVEMYYMPNFLDDRDLCQRLMALIDKNCKPSTVTVGSTRKSTDFRTSMTCYLDRCSDPVVDALQARILQVMDLPVGYSEPLQGQRYEPGQYFKEHVDFFAPGSKTYKEFAKQGNQRTWTFMIYLNDVVDGGYTAFPQLKVKFKPKAGHALIWNNLDSIGIENDWTSHYATPPEGQNKYVITQWFRKFNYRS